MSLIGLLNYFDQKKGQEQYAGLLDQYRAPADPNQLPVGNTPQELDQNILKAQGGFRGDGGLLTGGPPPEFYLRAAALPGYQQLAQQAQVGQQAMERQQQAQLWDSNNMSLAQKTAADAQLQRDKWDKERFMMGWNTKAGMTNTDAAQLDISRGNLGVAQAGLGLQRQRLAMDQNQQNLVRQYPGLGLTGQAALDARTNLQQLDQTVGVLKDTYDYLSKSGTGEVVLSPIDRNSLGAQFQTSMLPYLQKKFAAGAMQASEQELFQKLAGDPMAIFALKGKQTDLVKQWISQVETDRTNAYQMFGAVPQPVGVGTSAFAKSRSRGPGSGSASIPDDIQWAP